MPLRSPVVAASILGHQGGWDEIALVAGPVVVIAGLLILAKKRVDKMANDQDTPTSP